MHIKLKEMLRDKQHLNKLRICWQKYHSNGLRIVGQETKYRAFETGFIFGISFKNQKKIALAFQILNLIPTAFERVCLGITL